MISSWADVEVFYVLLMVLIIPAFICFRAYDDSILLVKNVTRQFYFTAEKLDDNREKIRNARLAAGVAVGVGVGASVVAAAATGGCKYSAPSQ